MKDTGVMGTVAGGGSRRRGRGGEGRGAVKGGGAAARVGTKMKGELSV